ncbi:MAG: hypothetical protein ABIK92_11310 [Pseudomonadota bacterium]
MKNRIAKFIYELLFIEIFALVIGAGAGFMQGIVAFSGQKTELVLQFGAWAAFTGMGLAIVIIPLLYFGLIRNSLTLSTAIELISLIIIIGLFSAFVLKTYFDAGWLSWIVTTISSLIMTLIYCKTGFRIIKN